MREKVFSFTKKDFRIDWFSGTGAGGQHRNKHQNCCRITHVESGFTATGQNHKERDRNQKEAFTKLVNILVEYYIPKQERERIKTEDVIRTYNQPDNRVKDHESGFEQTYQHVVEKNNIDDMVNERFKYLVGKKFN